MKSHQMKLLDMKLICVKELYTTVQCTDHVEQCHFYVMIVQQFTFISYQWLNT